jgi:hypothetical protein
MTQIVHQPVYQPDMNFCQLVKKYERGDLPKSDWLDKMAFRKMEEIHAVRDKSSCLRFLSEGDYVGRD